MKHMLYGDNSAMDVTFNARLQPATFAIPGKISKTFSYPNDGALRFSSDALDHRFDRSYGYDQAARLTSAFSGAEARGEGTTTNRPYNQSYGFDAFGHLSQRAVKTWSTSDFTISQTYLNNRRVGWGYDADGRVTDAGDDYSYDAAGRSSYLEMSGPTLPTAAMTYDGEGRQVKTVETWVDENFETFSETKYYVRSTVLGGQLLAELDTYGQFSRTFVYAGPAVLGWLWHSYSGDTMNWEQRDPSGATVRGIGEQELDPLGADAGTFATSVPPTERAIVSYGASYNPAHPNFTYSVDGIRVPLEDFIAFAGIKLKDPLGLLEDWARASGKPVGYRNAGVRWGQRFEVIYDANGKLIYETSTYNPTLSTLSFGLESPIYSNTSFDPTLLPQDSLTKAQATNAVKRDVRELLKGKAGKACKNFLNKVLSSIATSTGLPSIKKTFESTFNYLAKNVGFSDDSGVSEDMGNVYFLNGNRRIGVNFSKASPGGRDAVAYIAIHETFHAAASYGLYNHYQMAKAAFEVGKKSGIVPELVQQPMEGTSEAANKYNSVLFDQIVFNACGRQ
jgi:hypothetical protein